MCIYIYIYILYVYVDIMDWVCHDELEWLRWLVRTTLFNKVEGLRIRKVGGWNGANGEWLVYFDNYHGISMDWGWVDQVTNDLDGWDGWDGWEGVRRTNETEMAGLIGKNNTKHASDNKQHFLALVYLDIGNSLNTGQKPPTFSSWNVP